MHRHPGTAFGVAFFLANKIAFQTEVEASVDVRKLGKLFPKGASLFFP